MTSSFLHWYPMMTVDRACGLRWSGYESGGDEHAFYYYYLYVLFFFLLVSEKKKQGSRGHISLFTETKNTTGWGFLAFRFPSLKLAPNTFFS